MNLLIVDGNGKMKSVKEHSNGTDLTADTTDSNTIIKKKNISR